MQNIIPIIILNWNGYNDTIESVNSILKQTYTNFKIYLADNNSSNQEGPKLQETFSSNGKIEFIQFNENHGFTKAHNIIFEKYILNNSNYKYVALLNNDAFANKDWLENLIIAIERYSAGMIASKMLNYYNPKQMDNAGHLLLNTAEVIPFGHLQNENEFKTPFENYGACAGATLYSIEMLKEIGIFDPNFDTGYEDAELGIRATILGYRSIFEPSALVHHKMSQSINKIKNVDYLIQIQRNIFFSYFKLMPFWVLFFNVPCIIFKYGMVLIIDVVFRRWTFLAMMWQAIKKTINEDWPIIKAARKTFHQNHKTISSFQIMKKMTFFLWFDIKRFYKYVLLNKPTHFEK